MSFKSFTTKAIRVGQDSDAATGAVITPIFQTATYQQNSPGNPTLGYDYTRCSNPTRRALEECLASLEDAKYGIATASGLGAINSVFNLFKKGANIICGNDVYGGTYRLLATVFEDRYNVKFVDTTDVENIRKACQEFGKVDLLHIEAVSNPLLRITDVKKAAEIAKEYGAITCVDSTFLTPYWQQPINLGADIVVHSVTKYINGHSDIIGGAIFTNDKNLYDKLFYVQKTLGPSLSPFDSWLILRGVKTLEIRLRQHQENALKVANFLLSHPKVEKVLYPGFESNKNFEILKSQTKNNYLGGAMISFYLKGDADKFLSKTKLFLLAESLGGVESLSCLPAKMTHASVPKAVREANGITDNLIRLSVGIEGIQDLIDDLVNAFEGV
jgi:cystathionine gamma-lyase